MNKTHWFSLIALVALVIALPVYGFNEGTRMAAAQIRLQEQYVQDGIELYVQNCAGCHGASGEGIGMLPALNRPALAEADGALLFATVARATHGSAMAAWHVEEGGFLTDYQLKELVALIQHADWAEIGRVAAIRGFNEPADPAVENGLAYLESELEEDPHQCIDCHAEPAVHAEAFGVNCARCHNTVTWKPAVLTRHDFLLDHGGEGEVDCKTCHPSNYVAYDCYGCHQDHQAAEMETVHLTERIEQYSACADCHPTGVAGEAGRLREAQSEQQGQLPDNPLATPGMATAPINKEFTVEPTNQAGVNP